MDIVPFLKMMAEKNASDMFFSVGALPHIKIEGVSIAVGDETIHPAQMDELADSILDDAQKEEFAERMELNIAYSLKNFGRYRINMFRQRGQTGIVIRYLKETIPSIEALNLPELLKTLVMEPRGLVLVVGSTGSGKSTTLASMIEYRNNHHCGHILTIEDPIEYLHDHKQSIVDQREVGIDTLSYEHALKNAMREAPDVILIGEIRDKETMKQAIAYSETGHLCLSTLHANNANQTMERIINFFPEDARSQILLDLSLNLRAIISQRLIPGVKDKRVPAIEILLNTPYISALIAKGEVEEIKEAMAKGREVGMQTFDQALLDLYSQGKISQDNALRYADSKNNVRLEMRLNEDGDKPLGTKLSIEKDQ